MDKQKTGTMESVKQHVDAAFAALCKLSVNGPTAIPYAKALEELAAAALEMKNVPAGQEKDGGGET